MMAMRTLIFILLPSEKPVGVNEGTICTTTIAVWCNDGKRSPSCVWYQVGILIPKIQLYLIALLDTALLDRVSSFHLGRSEVSRPPEQIIQTLLPISQIHTETDTAWGMQLEHHTCHRNPLNSSIQIQAQIVSASYFLRSCTQYPGLQKCHLSVKHEVGLIFLRAGWCNCTNIRQHYYLFLSK